MKVLRVPIGPRYHSIINSELTLKMSLPLLLHSLPAKYLWESRCWSGTGCGWSRYLWNHVCSSSEMTAPHHYRRHLPPPYLLINPWLMRSKEGCRGVDFNSINSCKKFSQSGGCACVWRCLTQTLSFWCYLTCQLFLPVDCDRSVAMTALTLCSFSGITLFSKEICLLLWCRTKL